MNTRIGARPWLGWTHYDLARPHCQRGDRPTARAHVERARDGGLVEVVLKRAELESIQVLLAQHGTASCSAIAINQPCAAAAYPRSTTRAGHASIVTPSASKAVTARPFTSTDASRRASGGRSTMPPGGTARSPPTDATSVSAPSRCRRRSSVP